MITRRITAPGLQIDETDNSKYNLTDYSLPNAPVCLINGFASKGEPETVKYINTVQTFIDVYGSPSTEAEKYFYNAVVEVLNRGCVVIASKLPYNNLAKDKLPSIVYNIDENSYDISADPDLSCIHNVDSNINKYVKIQPLPTNTDERLTLAEYDNLVTGNKISLNNQLRIVDISGQQLTKTNFNSISSVYTTDEGSISSTTNDCLGIVPIIVSPVNALYFQNLLTEDASISGFNPVSALTSPNLSLTDISSNLQLEISADISALADKTKYYLDLGDVVSKDIQTVSTIATSYFPTITYKDVEHFSDNYLKQIGVVVLKAYADTANNNLINFSVVESYVGSLDKDAKDPISNSSIFIDNIVNSQSSTINIFSKVSKKTLSDFDVLSITNQTVVPLGLHEFECDKLIDFNASISKPLIHILDVLNNPTAVPIDIVIDAGVSNIAQYTNTFTKKYDVENIPYSDNVSKWSSIISIFDNFVRNLRKDCIFLTDCPRTFALDGTAKIIRKTNPSATIENTIIPKLKTLLRLNSSYSAGYCNWFQVADSFSGDLFWLPPSIKAASVCCYCDTYFNSWSAPAGMLRGTLANVIDVSFNPTNAEAGKIYSQSWNYAISYPLDGIVLEGQKTFQLNRTAFDRLNVRRLLLKLERSVAQTAKYFLYEGNTSYLREKFVAKLHPIFKNAMSSGGLTEYAIKCDDENNTQTIIDNNELRCSIAVKPTKTLEFILLNFVVTNQSANVSEQVI